MSAKVRNLSYAGRVLLINSVLESIQIYWAQVTILPKKVMRQLTAICRNYLWNGSFESLRPGAIAWDFLCLPKSQGGLGMRDPVIWNVAALGKYVWEIAKKKDNLWVKWVHMVYIKDQDWRTFRPSIESSWYWRKMCEVKDKIWTVIDIATIDQYSIKETYKALRGQGQRWKWCKVVWERISVPKHRFISWMATHDRLYTRERLKKFLVISSDSCLLCDNGIESQAHLFYSCSFSKACCSAVLLWMGCSQLRDLRQWATWVKRMRGKSHFQKQVITTAINALNYHIWRCRNQALWEHSVPTCQV